MLLSRIARRFSWRSTGAYPAFVTTNRTLWFLLAATVAALLPLQVERAFAAAPLVLHTPGYESPVHGNPDDLLLIAGFGFKADDRVVYQKAGPADRPREHPTMVPTQTTPSLGIAPIVQMSSPPYSLTVHLPVVMTTGHPYRLWVVNAANEWSERITINEPLPLWSTPQYVNESLDRTGSGRRIRVIGRNLEQDNDQPLRIRLRGPATYVLIADRSDSDSLRMQHYVAETDLPAHLARGSYAVAISRDGGQWSEVKGPAFEVRPDPEVLPRFELGDPRFGGCRADDGSADNECLERAIQAAQQQGGGIVFVPSGTWDLRADAGVTLPHNVHLLGAGDGSSIIVRHNASGTTLPEALITLTGDNSVVGLTFTDTDNFESRAQSRAVLQLGVRNGNPGDAVAAADTVNDIVIRGNVFRRVGRAIIDSGHPIARLFVTHNDFAAYDEALAMTGDRFQVEEPFRIDDSVIRWNHFVPGSYLDLSQRQGTIASELGASSRVDFSSNTADGASIAGLQQPADPKGWRAAFFWNLSNSSEYLLVAANRISCSGDKDGDGEAIAFDGNANTFAFRAAQPVAAADIDTVTIDSAVLAVQNGRTVDRAHYYIGHWVQIVSGPGIGQVRRVESYVEQGAATVFRVSPRWDVVPSAGQSRVIVGREYRHVYAIANDSDHRSPPCGKTNLSGDYGGRLGMWAPSTDSAIAQNRMQDTDGIVFQQAYVGDGAAFQSGLEILDNQVDGEYDWSSDCSTSGIMGSFAATDDPQFPPPLLSFAVVIAHNRITRADGLRGGAIDIASTWYRGPAPSDWPLVQSMLIFNNSISDIDGPSPRVKCGHGQLGRMGIRLEGTGNVRDTVLYGNKCEHVSTFIADAGTHTTAVCAADGRQTCECPAASAH